VCHLRSRMDYRHDTPLARAAAIAAGQHRILTLEQLLAAGLSRTMVHDACRRGALRRAGPGVYALGAAPSSPDERAMAAVLAARPTGLLSHHWCRWLFGVGRLPRHDPDVTVTANRDIAGVTIHRTRIPPTPDKNRGIPCTRPERMLIDCAPDLDDKDRRRLVNDVQIKSLASVDVIRQAIAGHPGRETSELARLVADDHGATRSLLEDLLVDLHRDHELSRPLINHPVEGVEGDFVYPHLSLVIEADGYRYHGATKIAFENDRAKWLHLESRGQRVIPVSYQQVTELRSRTARQLLAVIRR
jgi:very-short-patch-repair endonuclease